MITTLAANPATNTYKMSYFIDHLEFIQAKNPDAYTEQIRNIHIFNELLTKALNKTATPQSKKKPAEGCRDMLKCFSHGQKIRHRTRTSTWIGTYNKIENTIQHENNKYDSLGKFAVAHLTTLKTPTGARHAVNGWKACECEDPDGQWVSTFNLQPQPQPQPQPQAQPPTMLSISFPL